MLRRCTQESCAIGRPILVAEKRADYGFVGLPATFVGLLPTKVAGSPTKNGRSRK